MIKKSKRAAKITKGDLTENSSSLENLQELRSRHWNLLKKFQKEMNL